MSREMCSIKTHPRCNFKRWQEIWSGRYKSVRTEMNSSFFLLSFHMQEQPAESTFEVVRVKKLLPNNKQRAHCLNPAADMQSSGAFTECKTCSREQWSHWSAHVNCAYDGYISVLNHLATILSAGQIGDKKCPNTCCGHFKHVFISIPGWDLSHNGTIKSLLEIYIFYLWRFLVFYAIWFYFCEHLHVSYCDYHTSHKIHYIYDFFPCVKLYDSICAPPSGGPKALLKCPKCRCFKRGISTTHTGINNIVYYKVMYKINW